MRRSGSSAPADHFTADRDRLHELRAALASLIQARSGPHRLVAGLHHGLISAAAALIAYLPTRSLGLHEGYWSAITALSVVQTEFQATETTARDQLIGAAIGGGCAVLTALLPAAPLLAYAAAVVASILACWALNLSSASRLAGCTATILLLVPHAGSTERMFAVRLSEVGWGVCVAIAIVWIAARWPARLRARAGARASASSAASEH